jgi:tetratricopeptide (TPR) repeat protein
VGSPEGLSRSETDRVSFPDELRKRRLGRAWGQVAFAMELRRAARRIGVPEPSVDGNTVSRWERGKQWPDSFYQVLIGEALGLSRDELGLGQPPDRPSARIHPVKRREFFSYGASVAAAAALDLESLGAVLDRMHPPDDRRLEDLQLLVTSLEEQYDTTPPRDLMPVARSHLVSLRMAMPPRSPSLTRRLWSLTGEMAVLAGRLSHRLHNSGDAEGYYALGEEMGKECGNSQLQALALTARSSLYSNIGKNSRSSVVLTLLDEADRIGGAQASSRQQAWLLAHRAEEHAALGNSAEAYRDLDSAHRALAAAAVSGDGFFVNWGQERLTGYHGCCAVYLGEWQRAVDVLERAAAATSSAMISQRSAVLIDLATAYARQGEYEHACELLSETVEVAAAAHLAEIVRRVIGVRGHDLRSAGGHAVMRRLDDQLSEVALGR